MKLIEWRCWNPEKKKWEFFSHFSILMYYEDIIYHIKNGSEQYLYSGLLDVNNIHVYESDYIQLCSPDEEWIGIVKFIPEQNKGWVVSFKDEDVPLFDVAFDNHGNISLHVIGDIFNKPIDKIGLENV